MKINNVSQYQKVSYTDHNYISVNIYETILRDIAYYCFNKGVPSIINDTGSIVVQNTGTDYNVKVNECFIINEEGMIIYNPSQQELAITVPASSARIDIIQSTYKYTEQNLQSKTFINPADGTTYSDDTYTELALDMQLEVKEGVEGSGEAPTVDSGYTKICEIYVAKTDGIANADIFNVTSVYGEDNTSWTKEKTATILFKTAQYHRTNSTLDHPDECIDYAKLSSSCISALASLDTIKPKLITFRDSGGSDQVSTNLQYCADTTNPGAFYSGSDQKGVKCDGDFIGRRVRSAAYNDYADSIIAEKKYDAGFILKISKSGNAIITNKRGDNFIGIVTNTYAFIAGGISNEYPYKVPIAVAGQAPVFYTGNIKVGDKVIASKNGKAIKCQWFDRLLGRRILGQVIKIEDNKIWLWLRG